MEKVYFAKTRDVKSPTRGTSKASGIDMFIPMFDEKFIEDLMRKNPNICDIRPGSYEYILSLSKDTGNKIFLAPHCRICIPSGIVWKGKDGLSMNMHNKSGVATKKGLVYAAEVVDVDYTGETHISLINTSPYIVEICEGEKIVQILQEPITIDEPAECTLEEITSQETERGAGWQGSTGTN